MLSYRCYGRYGGAMVVWWWWYGMVDGMIAPYNDG